MEIQRRFTPSGRVQLSKRADGGSVLIGYAAVFYRAGDPGTEYKLWDDFVERIMPGAFDRAVREDDVRGLFNHESSWVLGRTTSRTCRLSVDEVGLRYEIDLPETTQAKDVATVVGRGDVDGSSFAFIPERTVWIEEGDLFIRQVEAVKLYDVGPVTYPAYKATSAGIRSTDVEAVRSELNAFKASRRQEADKINVRADLVKRDLTGLGRAA